MGLHCTKSRGNVLQEHVKPAAAMVTLHIYNVGTSRRWSTLNALLGSFGTGAFHCGVEIYGAEWSYADVAGVPSRVGLTGIFVCGPRKCEGHTYCQSLEMGTTHTSEYEVLRCTRLMEKEWTALKYDLLHRNCCHFCSEFCRRLSVGDIPDWVTALAGMGAAVEKNTWEVVDPKCCQAMAGEARLACRQRPPGSAPCCQVKEDAEVAGESDINYLL